MHNTLIWGGIVLVVIIFIGLIVMLYIQNRVSKMHEAASREKIRVSEESLARSQFLLNISHDIRTPMNAILGFTKLAIKEPDSMLRDYLKRIEKSSRQLQTVIDNILEMSRNEAAKAELELVPTDLCLGFEELSERLKEQMKTKRITFSVNTSVENRFVWCDKKALSQVFDGIISNSFKFTPEGGNISVSVLETGNEETGYSNYELRFEDSGAGMTRETLAAIFAKPAGEPTGEAENSLSLPAAKAVIEQLGGGMEVFSSPGRGTEIVIRIKFRLASGKDVKKETATVKMSAR